MRPARFALLFLVLAVAATGCIETEQKYTLNPDGSGKVAVRSAMQVPSFGGPEQSPKDQARQQALEVLKESKGVVAWKDVAYEVGEDGKSVFTGTAYFKNIADLEIKNSQIIRFGWSPAEGGGGVLTAKVGEEKDEADGDAEAKKMTDAEVQAEIEKERTQFKSSKPMMTMMMGPMSFKARFDLPGKVASATNFETTDQADAVRIALTGTEMIQAMEKVMASDELMEATVRQGRSLQKDGPPADDAVHKHLFGTAGPIRAKVAAGKPRFDFDAEVKAAKKNFAKMLEGAGLADEVPVRAPAAKGLKSVVVGGARAVWMEADDHNVRPFHQQKGYELAIICRFNGSVVNVEGGEISEAVTDTGVSLVTGKSEVRWPRLSEDRTTMMAELPLALPPADATRIKRLAGTLEFMVSTGTEEVDLEFPSFETGAKGHYLDAEIKEVAEEGKKIKIKLAKPAKQIEAIRFVDPDGAPIEGDRRGYFASRSVTTMEFELPRKLPPGSKILAVVHTDVKTYTTDWEVEDVSLLGR